MKQSSSTPLNLRSTILHLPFSFWTILGHFTVECLSKKVTWTSTSELWMPHHRVYASGFLLHNERPFTPPDYPSRTYYRTRNRRLYIHPLHISCLNHLLIIIDGAQHQLRCNRVIIYNHQGIEPSHAHEQVARMHYILALSIKLSFVTFLSRTCVTSCQVQLYMNYLVVQTKMEVADISIFILEDVLLLPSQCSEVN